jgi:hypothetical protein
MNFKLFKFYFSVIKKRGILYVWKYFWESTWFDHIHGIQTSTRVPKENQNVKTDSKEFNNGLLYVGSFTSVTKDSVGHVYDNISKEDFASSQFIDLGCGKGKALIVYALHYGKLCNEIPLGIEYDNDLAIIAKKNFLKVNFDSFTPIVHSDSALNLLKYVKGKSLIVYLYNSFQGSTLLKVLDILKKVPHILIYVDPAEKNVLGVYNYTIMKEHIGKYNADTWLIAKSG